MIVLTVLQNLIAVLYSNSLSQLVNLSWSSGFVCYIGSSDSCIGQLLSLDGESTRNSKLTSVYADTLDHSSFTCANFYVIIINYFVVNTLGQSCAGYSVYCYSRLNCLTCVGVLCISSVGVVNGSNLRSNVCCNICVVSYSVCCCEVLTIWFEYNLSNCVRAISRLYTLNGIVSILSQLVTIQSNNNIRCRDRSLVVYGNNNVIPVCFFYFNSSGSISSADICIVASSIVSSIQLCRNASVLECNYAVFLLSCNRTNFSYSVKRRIDWSVVHRYTISSCVLLLELQVSLVDGDIATGPSNLYSLCQNCIAEVILFNVELLYNCAANANNSCSASSKLNILSLVNFNCCSSSVGACIYIILVCNTSVQLYILSIRALSQFYIQINILHWLNSVAKVVCYLAKVKCSTFIISVEVNVCCACLNCNTCQWLTLVICKCYFCFLGWVNFNSRYGYGSSSSYSGTCNHHCSHNSNQFFGFVSHLNFSFVFYCLG